jgi:cytochrome c biogenesis protein CcdA
MTTLAAIGISFYLGLLCAISPCPLATNIAAVGFVSRGVSPRRTFFGGLFYALGRAMVYVIIAALLCKGVSAVPELSHFFQKYLNRALGPLMVIVGAVMLGVITLPTVGKRSFDVQAKWLSENGFMGALTLGAVFALAFCPTSAALFFGSLVPMSIERESAFFLPLVFGIGTSLPVVIFALLIALGVNWIGSLFNHLSIAERYLRLITGILFLTIGIVLSIILITSQL